MERTVYTVISSTDAESKVYRMNGEHAIDRILRMLNMKPSLNTESICDSLQSMPTELYVSQCSKVDYKRLSFEDVTDYDMLDFEENDRIIYVDIIDSGKAEITISKVDDDKPVMMDSFMIDKDALFFPMKSFEKYEI